MSMSSSSCPICQDEITQSNIITLPACKHVFHADCAMQYAFYKGAVALDQKMNSNVAESNVFPCPLCKTSITETHLPDVEQRNVIIIHELPNANSGVSPQTLAKVYYFAIAWSFFMLYMTIAKTITCNR